MTIKEVEKKLNITRANIRFYEKEGLLQPKRCDNEYRDYSEDDLKRLEKILLFRKCNISIENIRLIFNGVKNLDEVFKEQISVIENEVKQLNGAKISGAVKYTHAVNKEPNRNVLEMSVRQSLIDIANDEFKNDGNYIYAEGHKILDFEVKNEEIYVYVVANYGKFNENNNELSSVNSKKCTLTMIYKKDKNNTGIYELKEYKEDEIPDNLKEKANVNFEDTYFKEQLNSYCNR